MAAARRKKTDEPAEEYVDDLNAVASRVDIRVNSRLVYSQELYDYKLEQQDGGLVVYGTVERPQIKVSSAPAVEYEYNPTTDEPPSANTATEFTTSTVPAPDPEITAESAAQFEEADVDEEK